MNSTLDKTELIEHNQSLLSLFYSSGSYIHLKLPGEEALSYTLPVQPFKSVIEDNLAYLQNFNADSFLLLNKEMYSSQFECFMEKCTPTALFTDRDGTLSADMPLYYLSHRTIYNQTCINEWIRSLKCPSYLISSAALSSLLPLESSARMAYNLCGSNGMEYYDKDTTKKSALVSEPLELRILLTTVINKLKDAYPWLSWVRSGIQIKAGQVILNYKDKQLQGKINLTPFKKMLFQLLSQLPEWEKYYTIYDNGADIFINSKVHEDSPVPFHKRTKFDGLHWLNTFIPFDLTNVLVIGNQASDMAMIDYVNQLRGKAFALFVTRDEALQHSIQQMTTEVCFVSELKMLEYCIQQWMNKTKTKI